MPSRIVRQTEQPQELRKSRLHLGQLLFLGIFIAALIGCAYYAIQYHRLASDPSTQSRAAAEHAVQELSRVMVVPDEDDAILATVSDTQQLRNQSFFADAQNGDQVIIFPKAMKAVLFRPGIHKVIDIAPLSTSAQPSAMSSQASAIPSNETSHATSTKN